MCTVTALPASVLGSVAGSDPVLLRVACNRDEQVTREPALPPTGWVAGARRVLMPIDPRSGGTWIAANDAGLAFVLLNANPNGVRSGQVSRGTIVPMLVGSASTSQALSIATRIRADLFAPFRLLVLDRHAVAECWPERDRVRHRLTSWRGAWLRTSSSLGDHIVRGPRGALLRRLLREEPDPRRAQDLFHRHHWPGRDAISVDMRRPDARTVSRTLVEVREHTVTLTYQAMERPRPVAVHVAA